MSTEEKGWSESERPTTYHSKILRSGLCSPAGSHRRNTDLTEHLECRPRRPAEVKLISVLADPAADGALYLHKSSGQPVCRPQGSKVCVRRRR